MLHMTCRYLSFHGYYHLIRHEVMQLPSGLWQRDKPDDISARTCATWRNNNNNSSSKKKLFISRRTRNRLLSFFNSLRHPVIRRDGDFLSLFFWGGGGSSFGSPSNVWQSRDVIDFSPLCLHSLFKSFIRFSHSLAPFPIPSAQHAWSGQHRGAQRSIIPLQERSGWLKWFKSCQWAPSLIWNEKSEGPLE